jgi:hypothetical protein
MGRPRGTWSSGEPEAKKKLRQYSRELLFGPESNSLSNKDFGVYLEVLYPALAKKRKPEDTLEALLEGRQPISPKHLSEGYRSSMEQYRQSLDPEAAKAQQEWDETLARRKQTRQKRRPPNNLVRKPNNVGPSD